MKTLAGECLEKWVRGLNWSFLKIKTKCIVLPVQTAKGRDAQKPTKPGGTIILAMLLSRHLNCANITGEISSSLKKEKEVPIFL